MSVSLIVGNISQCLHISNQQILYLKYIHFKIFFFFFFLYKIPFQFPLLPLQYRSRSPSGVVRVGSGVGDWSEKVQDAGGGERV